MTQSNPNPTRDSLPTKDDFDPWGGDLDAKYAWKMFGGLTLEEARIVFLDRPESRQEDFMFMGGKAFAYYYPIIEDYLRAAQSEETQDDDREAWILAHCILNQFRQSTRDHVLPLAPRIIALSQFLQDKHSGDPEHEHLRIADAWAEVESVAKTIRESNS